MAKHQHTKLACMEGTFEGVVKRDSDLIRLFELMQGKRSMEMKD